MVIAGQGIAAAFFQVADRYVTLHRQAALAAPPVKSQLRAVFAATLPLAPLVFAYPIPQILPCSCAPRQSAGPHRPGIPPPQGGFAALEGLHSQAQPSSHVLAQWAATRQRVVEGRYAYSARPSKISAHEHKSASIRTL